MIAADTSGIQAGRIYMQGQIFQILQVNTIKHGQIFHLLQGNEIARGQIFHLLQANDKE